MEFEFFTTFTPMLIGGFPVAVGCDKASKRLAERLKGYDGIQFIHSGNPWAIPKEKRTKEWVLAKAEMLVNERTVGIMSLNVPPSYKRFDHWNLDRDLRELSAKACLENADWMLKHKKVKVPLYCTIYVSSFDESRRWFKVAIESGHEAFCSGVAEFLMVPKFIKEGMLKIVEVAFGARSVLSDLSFHLSGVASLNLLPILRYVGASSCDGSTPVRSALAQGVVYDRYGKAHKAADLANWTCDCTFCKARSKEETLKSLKLSPVFRLHHNVTIWKELVEEIKGCEDRRELAELIQERMKLSRSPLLKAVWNNVKRLEGTYGV